MWGTVTATAATAWMEAVVDRHGRAGDHGIVVPVSVRRLAVEEGVSPGTIGARVNQLEGAGLVVCRRPLTFVVHRPAVGHIASPVEVDDRLIVAAVRRILDVTDPDSAAACTVASAAIQELLTIGTVGDRATGARDARDDRAIHRAVPIEERKKDSVTRTFSPSSNARGEPARPSRGSREAAIDDSQSADDLQIEAVLRRIGQAADQAGRPNKPRYRTPLVAAMRTRPAWQLDHAAVVLADQLADPRCRIDDPFAVFGAALKTDNSEYLPAQPAAPEPEPGPPLEEPATVAHSAPADLVPEAKPVEPWVSWRPGLEAAKQALAARSSGQRSGI